MCEWQPDVKRKETGLRSGTDQNKDEDDRRNPRRGMVRPHGGEGVAAFRSCEHAIAKQQCERTEAGHDEINISGSRVVADAMMGHDERPRRKRHNLPGSQESEGVVSE